MSRSYLLMPDHELPEGRIDIGRRELLIDVSAVIVCQSIFEPPGSPVLDGDDAAHTVLLHQRGVETQLLQSRVPESQPILYQRSIGKPGKM